MDSLFSTFLLFLAAIVAMLTYLVIPTIPVVALAAAAAVALAAGIWWHWTQFSTDYRTSTWQEQLRNYASWVIVLVVILLSYGFYAFVAGMGGGDVSVAVAAARNVGRKTTSQIAATTARAQNLFFSEPTAPAPEAEAAPLNFLA